MRMSNKWDLHKKVTIYNIFLLALNRWFDIVNEYLEKYMIICQILWCATGAIYMWQNGILTFFNKCISEKEIDSNLEPVCVLFTFLPPLLQNRKHLSWIFGIDRGFACEWLVGMTRAAFATLGTTTYTTLHNGFYNIKIMIQTVQTQIRLA